MPFAFQNLPGEVRNQILRILLTHETPIIIHSFATLKPPRYTALQLHPNILLTCRATYTEGLTILYGENTFQAHPMLLTGSVFALDHSRPIKNHYIAQVRRFHIRVRLDSDPFYQPSAVKTAFSGAEELQVEAFRASFEAGGHRALDGFSKVRCVKRAKVYGSIDPELAQWLEKCMMSVEEERVLGWEAQGFDVLGPELLDTTLR